MHAFTKEIRSLLASPQAWAVATAYLIISGIFFVALLFSNPLPDLERYYSNIETTLIVVAPILAMRSFAEERRVGILDITLSWPVSRWTLVAGKYAANTLFSWALVSISWLYVALIDARGDIEVGKAAAGYFGVLLLVAMFNAVALAISAAAGSPTTAAFAGFGALLGLWILDFVPSWLGGRFDGVVRFLAPTTHLEATGQGVLDLGDVLYFVAGAALGLTLAALSLREPRRRGAWPRLLRGRTLGLASGFLVVVAAGTASASVAGQWDLTPAHRLTLTPQSREVLNRVDRPIRLVGVVQSGSAQQVEIRSLARRYQLVNDNVRLDFVDPEAEPARVKELGPGVTYGRLVVEIDGRREIVGDIGEIELTSAIQRLGREEPPLACFTVGHGERSIEDRHPVGYRAFASQLGRLGYQTSSLAIGAPGGTGALAACRVVVVAGPRALFLPEELAALGDFARAQGRLVILADRQDEVTAQLNELIQPWGLVIRPEVVHDRSSLVGDDGAVVAFKYPSKSPVTSDLRSLGIPVLLVAPQPVTSTVLGPEAEDAAWLTPLVTSSSKSTAGSAQGPFVLGAITDWSEVKETGPGPVVARTRIGVVGTADLASNQFIDRFGNASFAARLVSWVGTENDIIAAVRDPGGIQKLALTQADRGSLIRYAIVVPAAMAMLLFAFTAMALRRG